MSSADDRPQGTLETAVALFDELYKLVLTQQAVRENPALREQLISLECRRTDLEPRLAKRRKNQNKSREAKP